MFCLVHDFTFLMTDTKIKEQVPFESWEKKLMSARLSVKFVMLPVQSITLANWFACMPACTSAITRVSLTSLDRQILIITCLIYFAAQDMSFSGFWSSIGQVISSLVSLTACLSQLFLRWILCSPWTFITS